MKRLLATVLALAMLLTLSAAFADGITEENGIKTVLNQVSGKVIQVATADADLSAPIAPEDNPWASFDTSEPVNLVFYVVGSDGEDHQKVIDLANRRSKFPSSRYLISRPSIPWSWPAVRTATLS